MWHKTERVNESLQETCNCIKLSPRGTLTPCASFFAQQDHLGALNYVIDCLNFIIAMIGTSDQSCWLAKACKILLLLLLLTRTRAAWQQPLWLLQLNSCKPRYMPKHR